MSEPPKELTDEDGRWARRDVFVQEFAQEEAVQLSRAEEILSDLVESDDAPVRQKEMNGYRYIQLTGRLEAAKFWTKHKTKAKAGSVKDRIDSMIGFD